MIEKGGLRFPWPDAPMAGQPQEVAPGILWLRLPLPMALDHVNAWALEDDDGWTLIDPGYDDEGCRNAIMAALASPRMAGKPVIRVIATHHHPDHIGMAGVFAAQGATFMTTRTSWLMAHLVKPDQMRLPDQKTIAYWRAAGMPQPQIDMRSRKSVSAMWHKVAPLPSGYERLVAGREIVMGGRRWCVGTGEGHAPEHAVFWSLDDNLVIGGDQFLPGISPNLGVFAMEPAADPLRDWIESCQSFQKTAHDGHLVLPGHKIPFHGLPRRLQQMVDGHLSALERLRKLLSGGQRSAVECYSALFRRPITDDVYIFALTEAVAHLNYLWHRGEVCREMDDNGVWQWGLADA